MAAVAPVRRRSHRSIPIGRILLLGFFLIFVLVPLYWMFSLLMLGLLYAGLHPIGVYGWSWSNVVTSFLLLPQRRADGWSGQGDRGPDVAVRPVAEEGAPWATLEDLRDCDGLPR